MNIRRIRHVSHDLKVGEGEEKDMKLHFGMGLVHKANQAYI